MNSTGRLLLVATALLLLVTITFAQGPKKDVGTKVPLPDTPQPMDKTGPPQKDQIPRVDSLSIDVDLVDVDVVVTDPNGNPISGLTKEHFKVFDDNVQQTITNFSPTDAPLTVVLVLEFGDTFGYWYDDVVQPAHVLLALVREGRGVAAQVLAERAGGLAQVRDAATNLLTAKPTRKRK